MTRRKPVARVIIIGLTVGVLAVSAGFVTTLPVASPVAASPDRSGQLKAQQQTLAQALARASATYEDADATVQAAALAYAAASAELPAAQTSLAAANGGVIAASVALEQATGKATAASAVASGASAAVDAANTRVTAVRAAVSAALTASYEGDQLTQLNALMNVDSPGEVLNGLGYLEVMATNRRAALAGLVSARVQARRVWHSAVAAQRVAQTAQQAAEVALTGKQTARASALAARTQVAALIAKRQAALAAARTDRNRTLARYKALQKENAAVTRQLAQLAARERAREKQKHKGTGGSGGNGSAGNGSTGSGSTGSGGAVTSTAGYFPMPVHGWESSPFGMRYDPFYHRWQLHAGVDIAAAGGTPIRVAASGRVIRAGVAGGYGNYTCVDHGIYPGPGQYHDKGIATCYAHQSRILVHVGEQVTKGQVIGRVGETGAATGYHLHFEVRIDGRPVQPVSWLPKCFC